ncbi:MAG: NADH:ubiquinone oxidoreductase, partial [bacterium]
MSLTLYWLQCGGCGGDTRSFLSQESPDVPELFTSLGIEPLWHPSLSNISYSEHYQMREDLIAGKRPLDILCVEGSVIRGPGGTGMYDITSGKPKKDIVAALAMRARFILAVGTCASFGGIGADGDIEA